MIGFQKFNLTWLYTIKQCVENHPHLSRCPSSLFFDDIQKLCTFKNEAVCGPVATSKNCFFIQFLSPATK